MKKHLIAILLISCFLLSCAGGDGSRTYTIPRGSPQIQKPYVVNGMRYYPISDARGFTQKGVASWYGKKFHGRRTSNGEIYDMYAMTAAHKTLPFNTYVQVINRENNKSTVVRINDRGPFVRGRIIDLSHSGAKEIDMVGKGTAEVKIIALAREIPGTSSRTVVEIKNWQKGNFTVQIGAFQEKKNANNLANRLRVLFDYVNIMKTVNENGVTFYRLHVSKAANLTKAEANEKALKEMGFDEAFIVRI